MISDIHPTHEFVMIDRMDFLCHMCDSRLHWEAAREACIGWLDMVEA